MNNLDTCRVCKKLFHNILEVPICPSCKRKMDEKLEEVKAYIEENAEADITCVAECCDIEVDRIQEWMREKKLKTDKSSPVGVLCEHCGTLIHSGKLCAACAKIKENTIYDLTMAFKSAIDE